MVETFLATISSTGQYAGWSLSPSLQSNQLDRLDTYATVLVAAGAVRDYN
jgi:hypothetical protein